MTFCQPTWIGAFHLIDSALDLCSHVIEKGKTNIPWQCKVSRKLLFNRIILSEELFRANQWQNPVFKMHSCYTPSIFTFLSCLLRSFTSASLTFFSLSTHCSLLWYFAQAHFSFYAQNNFTNQYQDFYFLNGNYIRYLEKSNLIFKPFHTKMRVTFLWGLKQTKGRLHFKEDAYRSK